MQHRDDEPLVELLFRNGTLTVVGIILSFSLTFATQWANNPVPWGLPDFPAVVLLIAGIVTQARALLMFLHHDSLKRRVHDRATKIFITGLAFTSAGVIAALIADSIQLVYDTVK